MLTKRRHSIWPEEIWTGRHLITIVSSAVLISALFFLSAFILKRYYTDEVFLLAFVVSIGSVIALSVPAIFIALKNKIPMNKTGFRFSGWGWIFGAGALGVAVLVFGGLASGFWSEALSLESESLAELFEKEGGDRMWLNILYFKLVVALLIPVAEEIFFRGVIFRYIRQRKGFFISAGLSSLVFALAHFSLAALPYLFLLGFACAFAFERSRSLLPAIVIHFVNNNMIVNLYILSTFYN